MHAISVATGVIILATSLRFFPIYEHEMFDRSPARAETILRSRQSIHYMDAVFRLMIAK
jgi:hypothetical protein